MTKVLYIVDVRRRAALHAALVQQQSRRVGLGETSFRLYVDDNARHIGYVMLDWESLKSDQAFLHSEDSKKLVAEWPIEKILSAIPLSDVGTMLEQIAGDKGNA